MKSLSKIQLCILGAVYLLYPASSWATQVLFVSTDGNDSWSGEFAVPKSDGSDGPLATVFAAQSLIRDQIHAPGKPREEIIVNIRGGQYVMDSTLSLTAEDSGIQPAPITWQAYPGESVLINGGVRILNFKRLSETSIKIPVPSKYRKNIHVTNLNEQGIDSSEVITRRNWYDLDKPGPLEVYYNDQLMTLARYPNKEWVLVKDIPQLEGDPVIEGHHSDRRDGKVPTGRHYGIISYDDSRPTTWSNPSNAWLHGYWTWDWAESTQRIESIDTGKKRIHIAPPHHRYGYTTGQRYYYFNIPEELDAPGEWYLDRDSGNFYFWPPDDAFTGELVLASSTVAAIDLKEASYLTIKGLEFAYSRGPGIRIKDSQFISVENCRFHCMGGRPITIDGGQECGVSGSEFTQISTGAVYIKGGNRSTLAPANHFVVNNHIHDFSKVYRTNHPGVRIFGVGNRAAHNLIHNAPHIALLFTGNDHLIEFNEIHDIARETGDVGAIYIGRDYTSRGSIVRYNYLHHLHGPGLHGVRGVYLDDFTSGITVFGNVFYQAGRAAFIGGGRDNRIQNNLFIQCNPSVQIDGRGLSWANHHFDQDHSHYASTLRDFYAAANVTEPPYSIRYPQLVDLYDDEPKVPKYNVVENNLSFGGIFMDLYDGVDLELATVRNNLIADPLVLRMTDQSDQDPVFEIFTQKNSNSTGILEDNYLWEPATLPYQIRHTEIELILDKLPVDCGFLPIPMDQIGLFR